MEFLLELVVEVVVQFLGEVLLGWVLRHTVGRAALGGLVGLGFGCFWGDYLSGRDGYPKLLWVSLALAGLAVASLISGGADRDEEQGWAYLLRPPWEWNRDRLWVFFAINAGLALGVWLLFEPARPLF